MCCCPEGAAQFFVETIYQKRLFTDAFVGFPVTAHPVFQFRKANNLGGKSISSSAMFYLLSKYG